MRDLARRLAKLEARSTPPKPQRLVVRYEGCDWEEPEESEEPEPEIEDNTLVLTVRYVDLPRLEDR